MVPFTSILVPTMAKKMTEGCSFGVAAGSVCAMQHPQDAYVVSIGLPRRRNQFLGRCTEPQALGEQTELPEKYSILLGIVVLRLAVLEDTVRRCRGLGARELERRALHVSRARQTVRVEAKASKANQGSSVSRSRESRGSSEGIPAGTSCRRRRGNAR